MEIIVQKETLYHLQIVTLYVLHKDNCGQVVVVTWLWGCSKIHYFTVCPEQTKGNNIPRTRMFQVCWKVIATFWGEAPSTAECLDINTVFFTQLQENSIYLR